MEKIVGVDTTTDIVRNVSVFYTFLNAARGVNVLEEKENSQFLWIVVQEARFKKAQLRRL